MEEKELIIQTVQDQGFGGTATIVETSEVIDFVNPGKQISVAPLEHAIAQILRITKGNPPKEQIIGVLTGKK